MSDEPSWPADLAGVTESIVTTLGPNDLWNVAALGLHEPADGGPVTATTWGRTRTWRNFCERGEGYVQFTRDPVDFAEAALSVREEPNPVVSSADAWVRVRADRLDEGEEAASSGSSGRSTPSSPGSSGLSSRRRTAGTRPSSRRPSRPHDSTCRPTTARRCWTGCDTSSRSSRRPGASASGPPLSGSANWSTRSGSEQATRKNGRPSVACCVAHPLDTPPCWSGHRAAGPVPGDKRSRPVPKSNPF